MFKNIAKKKKLKNNKSSEKIEILYEWSIKSLIKYICCLYERKYNISNVDTTIDKQFLHDDIMEYSERHLRINE